MAVKALIPFTSSVTWQEMDGTEIGPVDCDLDLGLFPIGRVVIVVFSAYLGTITFENATEIPLEEAKQLLDYWIHGEENPYEIDTMEKLKASDDSGLVFVKDGDGAHIYAKHVGKDIRLFLSETVVDPMQFRRLAHQLQKSIKTLESTEDVLTVEWFRSKKHKEYTVMAEYYQKEYSESYYRNTGEKDERDR